MGLRLSRKKIDEQLARRQEGYGRGGRMKIEEDRVEITGGLRHGVTLGSPLSFLIENRDHENWRDSMSPEALRGKKIKAVTQPRPGHADLAGYLKTGTPDIRNILERASARETAARVAAGSACRQLLESLGVEIFSHVLSIGGVRSQPNYDDLAAMAERAASNDLHLADDEKCYERMRKTIKGVWGEGDTLGGVAEVVVRGLPAGIGHYVHWDRRLDARLASAAMSIPAVKGLEFGPAFENATKRGSRVMDSIAPDKRRRNPGQGRYARSGNRMGGLEGGMSNGQPLLVRAAMKPISSLTRPLDTVDIATGRKVKAVRERSDACAVPAMGVVLEAMVALILADAVLEQFSKDTMRNLKADWRRHLRQIAAR
jgi:chorismate synthase